MTIDKVPSALRGAGRRMLHSAFDETKEEVYWPGFLAKRYIYCLLIALFIKL
jgi:hypothetical protein